MLREHDVAPPRGRHQVGKGQLDRRARWPVHQCVHGADHVQWVPVTVGQHRGGRVALHQMLQQPFTQIAFKPIDGAQLRQHRAPAGLGRAAGGPARPRRWRRRRGAAVAPFAPHVFLDRDRRKQRARRCRQCLGAAQHQQAVGQQRVVEAPQHLVLGGALQIDQDVAARHQIHAQKGQVLQHVVTGKEAVTAQFLVDPQRVADAAEVALTPRRGQVLGTGLVENAAAGLVQRGGVHVGSQHHPVQRQIELAQQLVGEHGQAIDLFAAGAPHGPQAQLGGAGSSALADVFAPGHAQGCECRRVAQPLGDTDRDRLLQRLQQLGVALQCVEQLGQRRQALLAHHALDLAAQRGVLVLAQVQPRPVAQPRQQHTKGFLLAAEGGVGGGRRARACRLARRQQPTQAATQRHRGVHVVCQAPLDHGLRHRGKRCLGRRFGPHRAAHLAHHARAHRAVLPGARQHDGHHPWAKRARCAGQQPIQRRCRPLTVGAWQQPNLMFGIDLGVVAWWHHADRAAAQCRAIGECLHRQAADRLQQAHERRGLRGRDVLCDDARQPRIRGQRRHQFTQRLQTPGRGTEDGHDLRKCA